MAPTVVYEGVQNDQPNTNGLFAGLKIWFSKTVPQRSRFIADVKANGGEVVDLENQAVVCLFDHARKNPPPGTYSYRFVELSMRNGQLEDLGAHRIGGIDSRAARPVGSQTLASKGSRVSFTKEEDQILWEWMKPHEGQRGSAGNLLFQQLERQYPRHTYQSWRDRWLKYVQFQKRDIRPKNGQNQQDAAAIEGQSTNSGPPPRAASSRAVDASSPTRIVVEMPSAQSSSRNRGRPRKPRKPPQGMSDGDTTDVDRSERPHNAPNPTQHVRKEDSKKLQSRKKLSPQREDKASFREFSDEEREMLLNAAELILQTSPSKVDLAWEHMAEEHDTHTVEQWKSYFKEIILPIHRKRQKEEQQKIGAPNSPNPKNSGQSGDADAQSSAGGSRQTKGLPAHPHTKVTDQHENEEVVARKQKAEYRQRSPSLQPQSPSSWKAGDDNHRPGPNQSRKRSPAKTNSQESTESQFVGRANEEEGAPSEGIRTEQQKSKSVEEGHPRPVKRQKVFHTEVNLEIPSTPGNTQESETLQSEILEDPPGTPTPRARKRPEQGSGGRFSPLLVPSDNEDEEQQLPSTPQQRPRGKKTNDPRTHTTSPLSIHLVSDHDPTTTSSSSARNKDAESESTVSPTPEFETAPDFSHLADDEEEFETAEEEPVTQRATLMPDTQALFRSTTQSGGIGDLSDLPEPEGGWDAIEVDNDTAEADVTATSPPSSPNPSSTSSTTSTLNLDLDTWFNLRTSQGLDPSILLTAAEATNMHKKLADQIYARLERGEGVPMDMRGVWTKEDDQLLMGTDARGIARVEGKHGRRSVEERWECLGIWNE